MILAAPLVIPFAKAVGISIATLGMAKAVDMVNDYIQENPEESAMILKTLVPNLGIGEIFMKKEDKISLEDLDEMTDEEAQDLTKEEKAELMKQAGKSGGKNKRQIMIDLSEKLGLSGEGKEKQDIEYEVDERYDEGGVEEVSKPKFDYTKFFRKRRADGGAIGIEVLFEEKKKNGGRVGLFMGGSPLEGQALSIYNSMNAYGFDDQAIANALQEQGYYTPPGSNTPTVPEITAPNIIGSQINQGGGGDNNFGGQGIGKFGNLDPNTLETMQVEVADGMGGTKIVEKQTALTAGGLRKTLDNKNPVNACIDVKTPGIAIFESIFGKKTDDEFDPEGKIYGTFNNPNYKDMSFFGKIKANASRQKELKQLQKEFELQEQLKKQIAAQEAAKAAEAAATGNYTPGASNLTRGTSGGGLGLTQSQAQSVSQANKDAGYASFSGLKDGGLATMFTRRR